MKEPRTLRTHPEFASQRSFPLFQTLGEKPKSALERFLSLFADVRAGEGPGVLVLTLNVFLLLALYYVLKTVREALILSEQGAEVKTYAAAGQALLLLAVVPIYGWVATKVVRVKLVSGLALFFVLNLAIFAALGLQGVRQSVVFYIWLGIFNNFSVSQFWAFANDLYTEGQGRRLFPFIGIGASVGAWLGSMAAADFFGRLKLNPYLLMLGSASVLIVCAGLTWMANRFAIKDAEPEAKHDAETPLGDEGGFALLLRDRYLTWIAVLTLLLNIVNTSGEYLLGRLVSEQAALQYATKAEQGQFIGAFYGQFFAWTNLLGFLTQTFLVSRLFRHVGVRGALFFLPVIALVSYSIFAVAPILVVVRIAKVLENSTDYSLQNTVRQALWLPTSREAKYKAKAAVDTFITRMGDVVSAGVVYLGKSFSVAISQFAVLNVLLAMVWLWVAGRIAWHHRRRTV